MKGKGSDAITQTSGQSPRDEQEMAYVTLAGTGQLWSSLKPPAFQGEKSPSTSDIVVVVVVVVVGGGHERKYSFHTIKGHKNLTKDESIVVAQILGPTRLVWAQPGSKMGPHISLALVKICQNLHFSPFRMCSILFHACFFFVCKIGCHSIMRKSRKVR